MEIGNELSGEELRTVSGGDGLLSKLAAVVDTIIDICDDFEANGSCRPFQAYE